jgi:hypothetical protein
MGSGEPLGRPRVSPSPKDADYHESDTVVLDGAHEKPADAPKNGSSCKRKRDAFTDDDIGLISQGLSMVRGRRGRSWPSST